MYSNHAAMAQSGQTRTVAPETFLLDQEAQQSLPPESIVALQQVDNCELLLCYPLSLLLLIAALSRPTARARAATTAPLRSSASILPLLIRKSALQ